MKEAIDKFWNLRLTNCKKALEKNNFEAHIAETSAEAKQIVMEKIIPASGAKTFGYAGSITVEDLGILDELRNIE